MCVDSQASRQTTPHKIFIGRQMSRSGWFKIWWAENIFQKVDKYFIMIQSKDRIHIRKYGAGVAFFLRWWVWELKKRTSGIVMK